MEYRYKTEGVCSTEIIIDIDNDIIKNIEIINGCNGNLKGIASLLKGMNINDVIAKLKGIKCGYKDTSCPDQISKAIEEYKSNIK